MLWSFALFFSSPNQSYRPPTAIIHSFIRIFFFFFFFLIMVAIFCSFVVPMSPFFGVDDTVSRLRVAVIRTSFLSLSLFLAHSDYTASVRLGSENWAIQRFEFINGNNKRCTRPVWKCFRFKKFFAPLSPKTRKRNKQMANHCADKIQQKLDFSKQSAKECASLFFTMFCMTKWFFLVLINSKDP